VEGDILKPDFAFADNKFSCIRRIFNKARQGKRIHAVLNNTGSNRADIFYMIHCAMPFRGSTRPMPTTATAPPP